MLAYLESAAPTEGLIDFLQRLLPHRGSPVKSKKESLERFLTKQLGKALENGEFGSDLQSAIQNLITLPKNGTKDTPDKADNASVETEEKEDT